MLKLIKNGNFNSNKIIRVKDPENYSIGYYVKEFSIGHAMYFGETLFETREEAEEELKKLTH